jgi:hypothetical protein
MIFRNIVLAAGMASVAFAVAGETRAGAISRGRNSCP